MLIVLLSLLVFLNNLSAINWLSLASDFDIGIPGTPAVLYAANPPPP
jgi:hypothetical protein